MANAQGIRHPLDVLGAALSLVLEAELVAVDLAELGAFERRQRAVTETSASLAAAASCASRRRASAPGARRDARTGPDLESERSRAGAQAQAEGRSPEAVRSALRRARRRAVAA